MSSSPVLPALSLCPAEPLEKVGVGKNKSEMEAKGRGQSDSRAQKGARVGKVGGVNVKRREIAMTKRKESRKIVIKLSARSRKSRKALMWFNDHEITALKICRHTNADPPSVLWTLKDWYLHRGQEFPVLHDMKDNSKMTEGENKGKNFSSQTLTHNTSI